jgi:hypothetical protein
MKRFFISIFLAAISISTASAACTYDQVAPVIESGHERYIFLNECGFYEVGYRLDGNTLHLPRGGTHVLKDIPVSEAQTILSEAYGLKEVGGEGLIRTKGLFGSRDQ